MQKDKIKINKVEPFYYGYEDEINFKDALHFITVNFEINNIECKIKIETKVLLTKEEIKDKIIEVLQ